MIAIPFLREWLNLKGDYRMKKYRLTDYGVKTNCSDLQTKEIQAVLDLCKEEGGIAE
jgi:hypothetical protein